MPRLVVTPKGNRSVDVAAPEPGAAPANAVWIGPPAAAGEGFASIRCGAFFGLISCSTMQRIFSRGEFRMHQKQRPSYRPEYYWLPEDFGPSHVSIRVEDIPVEIAQAAVNLFEQAANGGKG